MRQVGALLAAAVAAWGSLAAAQSSSPPLDTVAQTRAIAEASALLRRNYVFPDVGAQAADRIGQASAAGDYAPLHDPSAFAARVSQDLLAATHDRHVTMIARVDAEVGPATTRSNGGFVRVERLKGNIGYAKLDLFPPMGLFVPFADEAMQKLAGSDALILDLRDNRGGAAASVTYFASVFFDQPTHVGDLINRTPGTAAFTTTALWTVKTPTRFLGKPVYILTSHQTFSGGEELADDLQAQKRAMVVGETTGGGANPGASWPLVDQRLRIFIPSSRAENPVTKASWEGSGVTPDLPVPADQALTAALHGVAAELKAKGAGAALAPLEARLGATVEVDRLVDAHLMALRDRPQPGSESALRKLMADLARGEPDYAGMETDIAAAARRGLPRLQADLVRLGAVKSVRFRGVGPVGADEFDVQFAGGWGVWMIYRLADGKLSAFGFNPSQ